MADHPHDWITLDVLENCFISRCARCPAVRQSFPGRTVNPVLYFDRIGQASVREPLCSRGDMTEERAASQAEEAAEQNMALALVWLSLVNAQRLIERFEEALSKHPLPDEMVEAIRQYKISREVAERAASKHLGPSSEDVDGGPSKKTLLQ